MRVTTDKGWVEIYVERYLITVLENGRIDVWDTERKCFLFDGKLDDLFLSLAQRAS